MITTLNIVTVYMSDDVLKGVSACVDKMTGAHHTVRDKQQMNSLLGLTNGSHPDVLIYQMNGASEIEYDDVCSYIEEQQGATSVIVIRKEADAESTRRLMRSGAVDVLPFPMSSSELSILLSECLTEKRSKITNAHGHLAGTTVFMNAKGGCGATTIALNTAYSLVKKYDAKVALLDFDIQFGDVALYSDLKPQGTLREALLQSDRLDQVFLNALMTRHSSGLDILAAPGNLDSISDIHTSEISKVLETVVEAYDFVVVDMPAIITPWTIDVLKFSEHIMLVVQNSLSTIKNAKLIMQGLPEVGVSTDKLELINNRAMSKTQNVDIEKLKSALGRERIHRIRNDFDTALISQDQGVSLRDVSSRSPLTKDIEHLSEYIYSRQGGENLVVKESLISRMFSHKHGSTDDNQAYYH